MSNWVPLLICVTTFPFVLALVLRLIVETLTTRLSNELKIAEISLFLT